MPKGRKQLESALANYSTRKRNVIDRFSGLLGIVTNGVQTVSINGDPSMVWVRLRNVSNEVIKAYNDVVSPIYDLPVIVERDKDHPTRYRIVERDIERYQNWPSNSAYLPIHGQSHSFNKENSGTGGDVVWTYQEQFLPLLVSPSGTYGAENVIIFPGLYVWNDNFRYAGNTGTVSLLTYKPTGSSNASILLLSLNHETGNFTITQGDEFDNSITGTAQVISYLPAVPEDHSPLAGVRLTSGTAAVQWANLYDVRSFNGYSIENQPAAGGLAGDGLVASGTFLHLGTPSSITDTTLNATTPSSHVHALGPIDVMDASQLIGGGDADEVGLTVNGFPNQAAPIAKFVPLAFDTVKAVAGFNGTAALFLGEYNTQFLNAGSQINTKYISNIQVAGNGSPVTLTSNPQITSGSSYGQVIFVEGYDSTNTVTLVNGNGLHLKSKQHTLYKNDWISFMWNPTDSIWSEMTRSSYDRENTWAFQSFHTSGTVGTLGQSYAMGHYRHAQGCSTFNPAKTYGYTDTAHGSKVYLVLGQDAADEITIRVSGDQIGDDGSASSQSEDVIIPATASVNDYFETTTYWVGTVTISHISGTERPFNYGFVRAWNNDNNVFRVMGLEATWFSRVSDTSVDLRLYHHTSSGWVSNTGSNGVASPTEILASMISDYGSNDRTYMNEYGSWYRNNLSTLISGSSEGLILMVRSIEDESFLLGNFTLRFRPAW